MTRHTTIALATATAAVLALSACGGGSSSTTNDKPGAGKQQVDKALAAKVPAAIKSDGTITIGVDSTYAPSEFVDTDGKTVIGFDVDLFNAVAAKLGLKTKWVKAPFDSIIIGVNSGKYEIGVSSFTIRSDREKQANMISYFNAGTQWATKKGDPTKITPNNACGHKVAVQKATVQVDDLTARSKKCTDAGKSALTIDQYTGQDEATAAVVSGKDDAMLADSPVCAYAVKQAKGQLELLGNIYDSAPYGYVVSKKQTAFADAISKAVQELIGSGDYQKALAKWGVTKGAITQSEVNPSVG
ncbi:MAG: polar amino acid transport system substrate-binding protein [Actinomycetota bacterium]|jgi:polar amino acid transport system substrate-binding protein|nr:polar amino acid transport system substrate-binding protein [Actinomycetota bacterium]